MAKSEKRKLHDAKKKGIEYIKTESSSIVYNKPIKDNDFIVGCVNSDIFPIKDVTGLDLIAGPKNIREHVPNYDVIPYRFKGHRGNLWVELIQEWFHRGLTDFPYIEKPGINRTKALAHIGTILASFDLKHEHKIAGCAYLLSQWFEENKKE